MAKSPRISDEKVQDYIDGRLNETDEAAVAAFLLANPKRAAEIQQYRHQNEALQALGQEVLSEPVPERLTHVISEARRVADAQEAERARKRSDRSHGWAQLRGAVKAFAVMLVFVAGGLAGWYGHSRFADLTDPYEIALLSARDAYQLYGSNEQYAVEFGADRESDLLTWVEQVFKRPVPRPVLDDVGYEFIGGRILPWSYGQQALYLFQRADGSRVGVVFWPSEKAPRRAPRLPDTDQLGYRYWWGDGLSYAIMSKEDGGDLDQLEESLLSFYAPKPQ